MSNNGDVEQKDWAKAHKTCQKSLQKECDLLRAYRRSRGHVDDESLENLKQEWLAAQKLHNENISASKDGENVTEARLT